MEQVFSAIPAVLKGIDSHAEVDEAIAFAAWSRCAGDLLQERTVPLSFTKHHLVIAVSDVTWQRHLEELSPQMLVEINGLLGQGTVKFIEFRIDQSAVNAARKTSVGANGDTSSFLEIAPALKNAANEIADEGLRNQFLGAAAVYLAKQKRN